MKFCAGVVIAGHLGVGAFMVAVGERVNG